MGQAIPVETAKAIAEAHGLKFVAVFGYDDGDNLMQQATYGIDAHAKLYAAKFGDHVASLWTGGQAGEGKAHYDFRALDLGLAVQSIEELVKILGRYKDAHAELAKYNVPDQIDAASLEAEFAAAIETARKLVPHA